MGFFESLSRKKSIHHLEGRLRISEERLKESEEKFRFLFDYDPNSIFVLKPKTFKILDANARALEVYGYKKEELVGKSFMDLSSTEHTDGVLSPHPDVKLSSQTSIYPKVQHKKKDGTSFYVDVYASQTSHSHKHGIIVATIDITESLAKETQLIQVSKMSTLGEMAAGVAHELNQPLNTIQIGIDFFMNMVDQEKEISPEELVLTSKQMAEQIDRAVHIINHLREFGRKADIQREKVDINKPLEGVFTLLSQQLKLRGIKVVLDLNEELPSIMGDANRLEQVFLNLVLNARDAMMEKDEKVIQEESEKILTVKSFQENDQVVVTVSDTGIGMSPDEKGRIFEPFFTTKEVGKGTGLGLSISYGIIKDYNGTIEVESEVGKGTTLKITFPACEEGQNRV
ncbi:MAG: PAS domain S-box protein [Deltaproteobacteria bacterium]|nr:MAG: PAS domain S-box protein [Deltaproteobacteria bacterium]